MGKTTMVIYDHSQRCLYEGELKHTANGFSWLREIIEFIKGQADQLPELVFEATEPKVKKALIFHDNDDDYLTEEISK